MSMNEVGSISHQQKKQNTQTEQTAANRETTVEVFGSEHLATNTDLTADESNSLFEGTFLRSGSESSTSSAHSKPSYASVEELPDDIREQYPKTEDQEALLTLNDEQWEQACKLMDTKLTASSIVQIVQIFTPEQVDTIKLRAEELQDAAGGKDNVYGMAMGLDNYNPLSEYNLVSLDYDLTKRTTVLDKDLNVRSIEKVSEHTTEDGKTYRIQEAHDLKNNVLSKTRYDKDDETGFYSATYEIRSKIKPHGSMVSRELIKPSEIGGLYDVEVLDETGSRDVSKTDVSEGRVTVRREMESPDGTKTQYSYRDDPQGNRYMRYKITTPDGEVLMNNTKTFTVVDEHTFKSTFNDKSYTMTLEDDMLTVVDDSNPEDVTYIDTCDIEDNREKLVSALKQIPGDQLISIAKTTDKLVGIDSVLKSYYTPRGREIHSGDDPFVVLHEEGHAKDYQAFNLDNHSTFDRMISQDKDFQRIYQEEKDAFTEAFPDAQREHVDYFINTLTHYGGFFGGMKETIAESNAILETPRSPEILGLRTQYLQQYFPRTIAHLNTLLQENREHPDAAPMPLLTVPKLEVPEIKLPKR